MANFEDVGSPAGDPRSQDRSIPRLVRDLFLETTGILRDEVRLARGEVTENIAQLRGGLTLLGAGVVLLIAGLVVLLDGLVMLIAPLMSQDMLWLAPLLVGAAVAIIGVALLQTGGSRINPRNAVPDQTIEETRRDRAMLRETMR